MLELNFLTFCVTVIALTAIVFRREDIVGNALSVLSGLTKDAVKIFGELLAKIDHD